jgi:uncharacterized repeat protein (TIGR01451 family)
VRVFNNTIMKNITTATAVTSNGTPAPAGLSTSLNSAPLQSTLPSGSSIFSNPLLFNNIFWDNRAGSRAGGAVTGIGATGDSTPIVLWDLGDADLAGNLSPTNSVLQVETGTDPSPTNKLTTPNVVAPYDVGMSFQVWRNNPAFVGAIMATVDVPPNLMGNYHLRPTGSSAIDTGAASKSGVLAPTFDVDNGPRPTATIFDIGADELAPVAIAANLRITKTDGRSMVPKGSMDTYTIVVSNPSTATVTNAMVTDTVPAGLAGATWTCTPTGGSTCTASGTGNISETVTLPAGSIVTFRLTGTVTGTAPSTLTNTARVAVPPGTSDPNTANNVATDTTQITPVWNSLDAFTRANANTLGSNWSQTITAGSAALRVNANQASAVSSGQAMWNASPGTFGAKQGAQITFGNTLNNTSLLLKASGGTAAAPLKFIRVRYQTTSGGRIEVSTTVNGGVTFTQRGTYLPMPSVAAGQRLGVLVDGTGLVWIYRTTGATTTLLGTRQLPTSFVGGGRIGMQLPSTGRLDNFSGGNLP